MRLRHTHQLTTLAISVCLALAPATAEAFGKKRPPAPSAGTQAYPVRLISMGALDAGKFRHPDGKTELLLAGEFPKVVLTEATQAQDKLRFQGLPGGEPTGRFVVLGGVTAFEANNYELGVRIGFAPGVDLGKGVLTGAEGEIKWAIGRLDVNFYVIDLERNNEVVAVGHGKAIPNNGSITAKIDFGAIRTGADFIYHRAMYPVFAGAIRKAFSEMASSPCTNFYMDWKAQVTGVDLGRKLVVFDAGARNGLQNQNLVNVYDHHGVRLGVLQIAEAQHEVSLASVRSDSGDSILQSIRPQDTVTVYFGGTPRCVRH